MEPTKEFLDVEEAASCQLVTVPDPPVRHRCALVGTLGALLLIAAVASASDEQTSAIGGKLEGARHAQVSPNTPMTMLTTAFHGLPAFRMQGTKLGISHLSLSAPARFRTALPVKGQTVLHPPRMTAGGDETRDRDQLFAPSFGGLASTVTPIGAFCPFRSQIFSGGPLMDEMNFAADFAPRFAKELSRMQLEMQVGGMPDTTSMVSLADDLEKAADKWSTALLRMRMATDFQAREFFQMTEGFAQRRGDSIDRMEPMMRWQANCMRAFATGAPMPPPLPGIDLDKLTQEEQQNSGQQALINQLGADNKDGVVTALPFTGREEAFKSEAVKKEYEQLSKDHANIIKMGEQYGTFDPLGKIAFLDSLEAIEERWDVFYTRFSLLGALNPEFKDQIANYLDSRGMSPTEYRNVLRKAHEAMRKDAEAERARGP